jgi:small subunit ribosomal protein S6
LSENQAARTYESTVILSPTLDDAGIEQHVEMVKSWIVASEGEVVRADVWGRRRLAYRIDGHREGVYTFFVFNGTVTVVTELARRYEIEEGVIRYLTVRADQPIDETTEIGLKDYMDSDDRRRGGRGGFPRRDRGPRPPRDDRRDDHRD